MKQLSLALNILLLVLVAILFYLHFNSTKKQAPVQLSKATVMPTDTGDKIAYFEMDSVQAHYRYFKDADAQLKSKVQAMKAELSNLDRAYQKKMLQWQQKGPSMSQAEAEAAQREKASMEETYQQRSEVLQESVNKQSMEFRKDIKLKIETFLKEYNKDNRFTYIFTSAPELIYYKDSTNDITAELLKGLNDSYKKK